MTKKGTPGAFTWLKPDGLGWAKYRTRAFLTPWCGTLFLPTALTVVAKLRVFSYVFLSEVERRQIQASSRSSQVGPERVRQLQHRRPPRVLRLKCKKLPLPWVTSGIQCNLVMMRLSLCRLDQVQFPPKLLYRVSIISLESEFPQSSECASKVLPPEWRAQTVSPSCSTHNKLHFDTSFTLTPWF